MERELYINEISMQIIFLFVERLIWALLLQLSTVALDHNFRKLKK